jgi:hypothetical protein
MVLIGVTLCLWIILAIPARWAWGKAAVYQSGLAALICLLPGGLTLAWGSSAQGESPERQLAMVLGSTGLRMFTVLGLGLIAFLSIADFHSMGFWVWVLGFYLFTLALEMILLVREARYQEPPANSTNTKAATAN